MYIGKYRSDCSGFVSAAWNHPPPGYTTQTMPVQALKSFNDLQPCDAILKRGSHIAMFFKKENGTSFFIRQDSIAYTFDNLASHSPEDLTLIKTSFVVHSLHTITHVSPRSISSLSMTLGPSLYILATSQFFQR